MDGDGAWDPRGREVSLQRLLLGCVFGDGSRRAGQGLRMEIRI